MAETRRWNLRNLYLYGVCFVTLMVAIFSLVGLATNVFELFYPVPDPFIDPSGVFNRRENVLGIVADGVTLAITVPVFWFHWRIIKRSRNEA